MLAGTPTAGPDGPMRDGAWLVSGAGIRDVFENITHDDIPTIRHKPSGLICRSPRVVFAPKQSDPSKFDPANLSGCITRINGLQVDFEAGLNNQHTDIQSAMSALITEIKLEQKDPAEAVVRATPAIGGIFNSPRASAQLTTSAGDEPRLTYVSAAALGD
jgi:hypothetical protein